MAGSDDDRFLDEAVLRGLLTREQADDCRRLRDSLAEVEVALTVDEVLARKGFLTRERSAELRRALARQRVGRYEVLERLGEGGSGVVWKARDVVLDRVVALKLLSRNARDDAAWRERFLREARTAVALNHVGLVRGLDCGEDDGYLWFAMEYVPGETVAARLKREGRLPQWEVMRIGAEVARVLRYVAERGIVHRDLKPDNILVATDGRVKVCDLGLAKPTREGADRAGADSLVAGTLLYVAPEQIRDGDRVDWRADVYSLGATLYHLLAGRPPFVWVKGKDLLACHLREVPPSPREFALDVTPEAAAVVLKMLQKDPADRYGRLEDLESDLESVMAGRPPIHTISFAPRDRTPAGSRADGALPASRAGVPWAAVGATVLALVMVSVASVLVGTTCIAHWSAVERPPGRPPTPRAPPVPTAPASANPPAGPPAPPKPPSPRELEAVQALEIARKFAKEHPADLPAQSEAFRFVAERYAGTEAADVAAGVAADADREFERQADLSLGTARAESAESEASGRLVDAARRFESVAVAFAGTRAAASAAAESKRLRGAAREGLGRLVDEALAAIQAHDFDGARARLLDATVLGVEGSEREIAVARRRLDASEAAFTQDRTASRAAFERLWGGAVIRAGDDGVEVALAALDEARAELPTWTTECDTLRMDILSIRRAAQDPPPAATPSDVRAAFFARLARRDIGGAESLLPRLEGPGSRADELREGLRRVRSVLAAAADELLTLAEAARRVRRFDESDRFVERAFAEVPGHPRARVVAAAILADRGRPDEALAALDRVLDLPAPPPEARLRKGQILAARRDGAGEAQREIELFLTLSPETDPLRAEARAALESLTARRDAARVRELQTELALARDRGEPERVIEVATAIQALVPTDARSLLALGDAYAETGCPHDAFLAYRRLTDGKPYEREWPKAGTALRRLEQRYPPTPRDRETAAATQDRLGRGEVAEARQAFEETLARAPFLEDALCGAAEAWLAKKGSGNYSLRDDPRRALRLTEVLLLRNPSHLRGMELRAEALLRTGAPKEALELATKAIDLDPVRPDPATTAGYACLALQNPDGALARFQTSLSRRRTPQALFGRVLAWEDLGRRPAARDEALALLEEFGIPDDMAADVEGLLARLDLEFVRRPK